MIKVNLKNKANYVERQKLKGKRKNESKSGVSPVAYLKKQSQFIRIAYCVMRIAKRNLKKQSQFAGE